MFQMGMTASHTCQHCTFNDIDNYLHAFWYCTPIDTFWYMVRNDFSTQTGCAIKATPSLCLFGDLTSISLDKAELSMLITSLSVAKKAILMNWKTRQNLHIAQYRNMLLEHSSFVAMWWWGKRVQPCPWLSPGSWPDQLLYTHTCTQYHISACPHTKTHAQVHGCPHTFTQIVHKYT